MATGANRVVKRTRVASCMGASSVMRANLPARSRSRRDAVTGEMIQEQLKPLPRSTPSQRTGQVDRAGGQQASMRKALNLPRISSYERTLIWTQTTSNLDDDTVNNRRDEICSQSDQGKEVYDEINTQFYADAVPDMVKRLPFSTMMFTHPKLFSAIIDQMKADENYFQWMSSTQDWHLPNAGYRNEFGIPASELGQSIDCDLSIHGPMPYGPIPHFQSYCGLNDIQFRDPWVMDAQVQASGWGMATPPAALGNTMLPCLSYPPNPDYGGINANGF